MASFEQQVDLCLSNVPPFDDISSKTAQRLLMGSKKSTLHTNEHLIWCGEPLLHYYWLQAGQMQLYRPSIEGEDKVFYVAKPNKIILLSAAVLPQPISPFSVLCVTDCVIRQLSIPTLLDVAVQEPELMHQILAYLSVSWYQSINRIDTLTHSNARQRLVLYLLEISQYHASLSFDLGVSIKVLAKQINISPETLSRILSQLSTAGVISYAKGHIDIPNITELKRFVELPVKACSCQSHYQNHGELLSPAAKVEEDHSHLGAGLICNRC